jgi:hypothetical protein
VDVDVSGMDGLCLLDAVVVVELWWLCCVAVVVVVEVEVVMVIVVIRSSSSSSSSSSLPLWDGFLSLALFLSQSFQLSCLCLSSTGTANYFES